MGASFADADADADAVETGAVGRSPTSTIGGPAARLGTTPAAPPECGDERDISTPVTVSPAVIDATARADSW